MFADYVYEIAEAEYRKRIIIFDTDKLENRTCFSRVFMESGFEVVRYKNDLLFRTEFDFLLSDSGKKAVILVDDGAYLPFDIISKFKCVNLSLQKLFPKLNAAVLRNNCDVDIDFLTIAYMNSFDNYQSPEETESFLKSMYSGRNVKEYLYQKQKVLSRIANNASSYNDWFKVSELKSEIDVFSTEHDVDCDTDFVNSRFLSFVISRFGKLSSDLDKASPVLVSHAMEYMHESSNKFAIIVMDGMSQFDWAVLRKSFDGVSYTKSNVCAMIPTTTSISRQCLLSNKFPSQLIEPWKQSKEKAEFTECAKEFGYSAEQIGYERGYEADFPSTVKCAAVIVNDIDDLVHGQKQGRIGMFNDITVLSKQGQLVALTRRLLRAGFDVYISADHGNTPCVGMGKLMKTGVEVETKSRRMLVLKDFADKDALLSHHDIFEYPKYYLNKAYDYLICGAGCSFDAKGEEVMSHGGITVDEVIVPFIKMKAVDNNG